MAHGVTTPDGVRWRVGRRVAPAVASRVAARARHRFRRPRRSKGRSLDALDTASEATNLVGFDDDLVVGVLAVLVFGVLVLAGIPLLLLIVDAVLLVVVTVVTLMARFLFRRPWIVEARLEGHYEGHLEGRLEGRLEGCGESMTWRVRGWRASGSVVSQVAAHLARGKPPRPELRGREVPMLEPTP